MTTIQELIEQIEGFKSLAEEASKVKFKPEEQMRDTLRGIARRCDFIITNYKAEVHIKTLDDNQKLRERGLL